MGIFHNYLLWKCYCLFEKTKINEKEAGDSPFFNNASERQGMNRYRETTTNDWKRVYTVELEHKMWNKQVTFKDSRDVGNKQKNKAKRRHKQNRNTHLLTRTNIRIHTNIHPTYLNTCTIHSPLWTYIYLYEHIHTNIHLPILTYRYTNTPIRDSLCNLCMLSNRSVMTCFCWPTFQQFQKWVFIFFLSLSLSFVRTRPTLFIEEDKRQLLTFESSDAAALYNCLICLFPVSLNDWLCLSAISFCKNEFLRKRSHSVGSKGLDPLNGLPKNTVMMPSYSFKDFEAADVLLCHIGNKKQAKKDIF